jgi:hypothetical protein
MNRDALISARTVPRMGTEYLKIVASGEIVKWRGFSEITQLYDVESAEGKRFTVQSDKLLKLITPEEEAEFLRRAEAWATAINS